MRDKSTVRHSNGKTISSPYFFLLFLLLLQLLLLWEYLYDYCCYINIYIDIVFCVCVISLISCNSRCRLIALDSSIKCEMVNVGPRFFAVILTFKKKTEMDHIGNRFDWTIQTYIEAERKKNHHIRLKESKSSHHFHELIEFVG